MHYNLVNEAMNLKAVETPQVGMVGTMFCGTDRWPMVCTEILGKKKVRASMMSDADYTFVSTNNAKFVPDDRLFSNNYFEEIPGRKECKLTNGKVVKPLKARGKIYTLRKNNRWMEEGHDMWQTGAVHFGHAEEYRDPNF